MEEVQSNFRLEQFTSEFEEQVYHYAIVHMVGSAYVWVGLQKGEHGCMVMAITPRIPVPGQNSAMSLVGGGCTNIALAAASRLNAKLQLPIILSLDLPEDPNVVSHVESEIVTKLSKTDAV